MRHLGRFLLSGFAVLAWSGCAEQPSAPEEPLGEEPPIASRAKIAIVRSTASSSIIHLANADGTGVVPLTTGSSPAWSWDGRRIAFNRGFGLYVVNADGSGERLLASHARGASWSPDGSTLAYEHCTAGPDGGECYEHWDSLAIRGIGVANVDGSGSRLLIPAICCTIPEYPIRSLTEITWSPDGRRIAFIAVSQECCWGSHESYLWIASADGSTLSRVEIRGRFTFPGDATTYESRYVSSPAWSPDGSRIGFTTHDVTLDRGQHPVVASIPSDGTGVWQVHYRCGRESDGQFCYLLDMDWSPDGRLIAFGLLEGKPSDGKGFRTYVLDVETGETRQIIGDVPGSSPAYSDWGVAWSRVAESDDGDP